MVVVTFRVPLNAICLIFTYLKFWVAVGDTTSSGHAAKLHKVFQKLDYLTCNETLKRDIFHSGSTKYCRSCHFCVFKFSRISDFRAYEVESSRIFIFLQ